MGLLHNRISRLCCHVNWYKKKPMQFQNKQTKGCWKIDCLLVVWPLFQALRKYPWKTTIISTSMDGLQFCYWMWIWRARSYVKRSPNFCFTKIGVWLYDSHLWFTTFEAFLSQNKVLALLHQEYQFCRKLKKAQKEWMITKKHLQVN